MRKNRKKNGKRIVLVASFAALLLSACGNTPAPAPEPEPQPAGEEGGGEPETVDLTLWTYPVGNFGNPTSLNSLLAGFRQEHPEISLTVEYLTYDDGDARIEKAIEEGAAPDLVLEGPERLVANWGDRGLMADISDLWDSPSASQIYSQVREACQYGDVFYEFPLCMTTHCMAINYDMFREAGALQYIDEESHTWTTEGFIQAVQALRDYGIEKVGVVYCKSQAGDQGTRALVNNMYGGSFTDAGHTAYAIDSPENIQALQTLAGLDGIVFEPLYTGVDAMNEFTAEGAAMSFCWNVSMEIQHTINNPDLGFDVFPMAFPAPDGQARLQGGIWGLGVFDNGDQARIEAAKELIRFMAEDDAQYNRVVLTSSYWPVRELKDIYINDLLMTEYSIFTQYAGDYYQITPGWTGARAAWWKLLQEVGAGADVAQAVKGFPKAE